MCSERYCSECGGEIGNDTPGGQCARCLMSLALDPLEERTPPHADAPDAAEERTAVSRYTLLEKLAEGGFGEVWVAEQRQPVRRRVALKLLKLGMDTRQVVARFEAERQALALMDHPNIAKVLDAGATENGRPYFVMELVRGVPVTQYCRRERPNLREQLGLFIKVCHAIQHAHQKGIIHRDIKPSNVLVTLHDGMPVPKVIDFGIAKAMQGELTDKTIYTQFHQLIGTPAYMSPEQAEMSGLDIDTRSDIYSLGVLLYELLTGSTPFETRELMKSGVEEMRRVIREVEPPRPSTRLSQSGAAKPSQANRRPWIEKDLDWIVMKCLEKDRTRRYETANGLAMDIQRHLNNEPVLARPPSTVYRLQKVYRRHKLSLTAAAAVLAALVAGVTVSTWQAIEANRARTEERQQRLAAQAAVRDLRRLGYVSDIQAAHLAIGDQNFRRARDLLSRHFPGSERGPDVEELRGFEWRYLWNESRGLEQFSFRPHAGTVESVAWSPDGSLASTGGDDEVVRVWQTQNWRPIAALPTSTSDRLFRGHSSLAFSPNGKWLARGAQSRVVVWETARWTEVASLDEGEFPDAIRRPIGFSPGSETLAAATAAGVGFWNTGSWEESRSIHLESELYGSQLAYSDDGRFFAVAPRPGAPGQTELWDGTASRNLHRFYFNAYALGFSPGGDLLAAGAYDGTLVFWDVATFQEACRWKAHRAAKD